LQDLLTKKRTCVESGNPVLVMRGR
jgi:hypothetical protein